MENVNPSMCACCHRDNAAGKTAGHNYSSMNADLDLRVAPCASRLPRKRKITAAG
jgi:hypothetical protein